MSVEVYSNYHKHKMQKPPPVVKLIPFPASEEFIYELRKALKGSDYNSRSQFIREAIVEKFQRMGVRVKPFLAQTSRSVAALEANARVERQARRKKTSKR
jgi:hypothetical protein